MFTDFLNRSYDFAGNGVTNQTATKNTATNIDFKLPKNLDLQGGELLTKDNVWGDWVEFKIIDIDGITYTVGTVLKIYVIKWSIRPGGITEIGSPYVGKIPKDMYIRCIYHSIGTSNDVKVSINYYLHEKIST